MKNLIMKLFQSIFERKKMNNNQQPEIREFTAVIKMIHGEEIIGKVCVTDGEDGFVVDSPFVLKSTIINTSHGEMFKVDLIPWLKFAKDEVCFIDNEKIYVITEADDRIRRLYNATLRKYYMGDEATNQVELTKSEGRIGSVDEARSLLENIYKSSN